MSKHDCHACHEYNELSRRDFLRVSGGTLLAASAPAWLPRVTLAAEPSPQRDIAVVVYLRGGVDGLSMCIPYNEAVYYNTRPTIAIPAPDSTAPQRAIALTDYFAIPPNFAALLPAYQAGHLLFVHACGLNIVERSHFAAQLYMEAARSVASDTYTTGWLGRHLASIPPLRPDAILRAIGTGRDIRGLHRSLDGGPLTLPIADLDDFGLTTVGGSSSLRASAVQSMYARTGDPLRTSAQTTQQTIDLLNLVDFASYRPAGGAAYPGSNFGYALKSSAALIKAQLGVEAIAIDIDGWDTHAFQGDHTGYLGSLFSNLANSLAAFHADMFSGVAPNVTLIVMTEFGRNVAENGSYGTDHGRGGAMMLMGRHIAGGRVLTDWPGIHPDQWEGGRDLRATIDYRDILSEVVQRRLGNANLTAVFPGYTPRFRGVTTTPIGTGDVNCDGVVNFDDIDPFVLALTGRAPYETAYPDCDYQRADTSGDGAVNFDDIDPFVSRLAGGS